MCVGEALTPEQAHYADKDKAHVVRYKRKVHYLCRHKDTPVTDEGRDVCLE